MSTASALIRGYAPQGCRPWERYLLPPSAFAALPSALDAEPSLALVGLWAEPGFVHAAFLDEAGGGLLLASTTPVEGRYPALSPARPGATLLERAVRDLWGYAAEGGGEPRPLLDHGRWPLSRPLAAHPGPRTGPPEEAPVLPAGAEGLHQIPLGPVRDGTPAHLRLTVQGEAVQRMEARLGYAHRGILSLMQGRSPRAAARFAARIAADSAVAHAWAFAMAAEAATATAPPPRAVALRGAMAELERIACHLRDLSRVAEVAGMGWPASRFGLLREGVLRATARAFGSRLLLDAVVPGGVQADLAPEGAGALLAALRVVEAELPGLEAVLEGTPSFRDRLAGIGVVPPDLAARLAAGGVAGRASGRGFDARRDLNHAPYYGFAPEVPVLEAGDALARTGLRLAELRDSLVLAQRMLPTLPEGETLVALPQRGGEGVGCAEGPRGEVLAWMALDDGGLIRAVFQRDPAWAHWPLLEAVAASGTVGDVAVTEASLNPSAQGVDL
ncbi:MAG TPA: hydrogenase expression protein HypE [Acetobacteraceae bacterium]|nr:hydrogenase expression protein HypE [Acetobacteraceae bacterium]